MSQKKTRKTIQRARKTSLCSFDVESETDTTINPYSAGTVFILQIVTSHILTYKDDSCDERIKIVMMARDP